MLVRKVMMAAVSTSPVTTSTTTTAFKETFKFYKKRVPPPDLSDVIDLRQGHVPDAYHVTEHELTTPPPSLSRPFGVRPTETLRLYSVVENPGLFIIPNALTEAGQHYWMLRGLKQLPDVPHKCNLDAHLTEPRTAESNLFKESEKEFLSTNKTKADLFALPIYKLRWVTLGYHYDYNTKTYTDDDFTAFPSDLGHLSRYLASLIGYGEEYSAEAAIVNYYHLDSALSGHTDHSEDDLEAPLLSLSLGRDAVFVIGGETLDTPPTPLYLRSGDLVVLWKEARLAYHGVPRICDETSLPSLTNASFDNDDEEEANSVPQVIKEELDRGEELKNNPIKFVDKDNKTPRDLKFDGSKSFYQHYLKFTRININIRQVKTKAFVRETPAKKQKV